jgi:Aromatic-ring-opening dioxygenase LigAB, LigA subunit
MATTLADFLIQMSNDLDLQHRYADDPEATMTSFGLTDAEKAALRSGDEESIKAAFGPNNPKIVVKFILPHGH